MSTTAYAWAPITKVEDQADGTVMVYGPAADAGVDRDKQRLNQEWLDTAMPAWMAEGGNVREQHDPKRAVGVGVGMSRDADGAHMLAAAVVDPVAITKVRPGPNGRRPVLTGFSVGIKDPQIAFGKADAPNGEVVGGSIIEVSLVDRPSNPRTLFTMVKADAAGQLEDVEDPEVVDETVAKAEGILAELRALVPDLDKVDAAGDIAEAMTAIACVGRLIASEATSLAAGQLDEDRDIACLLDAVGALKFFICREQAEPGGGSSDESAEVADSMSVSGASYMADEIKTETPAVPAETPSAAPDLAKVDSPALADIVKAAIAEVNKAHEDRFTAIEAQLTKALAMPETGGPVGMRTAAQAAAARGVDAASLRAQAAEYLVKADDRGREDPLLADGYRARAAELLAKADA